MVRRRYVEQGFQVWLTHCMNSHQTSLLYPLPSSHPQIYTFKDTARRLDRVSTQATLTSSPAVAARVRALERTARRAIGIEDREALSEGLLTVAEEYVEGWDSASDDDEDSD